MGDSDFFTGTLTLLILRTLQGEPRHGYAIGRWLREHSSGVFDVTDGVLYTALHRLEEKGLLEAAWGRSERGRRAKYYRLTPTGAHHLQDATEAWERYSGAVAEVLNPEGGSA